MRVHGSVNKGNEGKKEQAQSLYNKGLSTRQIATYMNMSSSWVHRNVTCRSQQDAAILRQIPKSKHWRSARMQARNVWKRCVGEIPKGYHIHHKDGDYTNNCFSNLQLIEAGKHARLYHPKSSVPKWISPQNKEYMKKYMKWYLPLYRERKRAEARSL